MKHKINLKHILSICLVALIFTSCSSSKNGMVTNKASKGTISGTWKVNDVSLEGFPSGYEIKNVFDIAPYQDFIGSTWTLNGGYSGKIALPDGTSQDIYWSLINDGVNPTFQFKKIDAGEKAKEVTTGYQLNISEATKTSLVLRSPFTLLNGNTAYIVYTFVNS